MNIDGTYKIDLEMTARKSVEGLVGTAKRLLGHLGADGGFDPPGMEEHIAEVVAMYRENQEVFDDFTMTIAGDTITVRTSEGELVYRIKDRVEKGDSHLDLNLAQEEMGDPTWDVTLAGNYFLFDSFDGLSEYVFIKQN